MANDVWCHSSDDNFAHNSSRYLYKTNSSPKWYSIFGRLPTRFFVTLLNQFLIKSSVFNMKFQCLQKCSLMTHQNVLPQGDEWAKSDKEVEMKFSLKFWLLLTFFRNLVKSEHTHFSHTKYLMSKNILPSNGTC